MKTRRSKAIILSLIFAFVVGLILATAPSVVMGANKANTSPTEAAITQTGQPATANPSSNPIQDSTEPSGYCGQCYIKGKAGYIVSGRCLACF